MATITLQTPEGETHTFECDEDTSILDALEEGWSLLCVATPESDCVILTEQEDNVM